MQMMGYYLVCYLQSKASKIEAFIKHLLYSIKMMAYYLHMDWQFFC